MAQLRDRIVLRVVFVLIGAALALAIAILDVTIIALLVEDSGLPFWTLAAFGAVVVVVPLCALGLIPAMRTVEGVAATSLLGVDLPGALEPARTSAQRGRTLAWFVLHVLAGSVVVAAVAGAVVVTGLLVAPLLLGALIVAALLGAGLARIAPRLLGPSYGERLALLERDMDRAVERNRLAREIHDSVGHALSLVTVQAGAARRVLDTDRTFAVNALEAIEQAARDAAADLDHVLGLLREDGDTRHLPAADLGALDALVRATRAAGLDLEHRSPRPLGELPGVVSREGYRVVQEALTNALRYSADSTATLSLVRDDGRLLIEVENPVDAGRPSGRPREGHGLRGISERVQALGGSLVAGPVDGRWRTTATIPVAPPAGSGRMDR
ncbi:signal transduction histidine kinase [Nocardioides thalensis]|uniref:histidine kinase n=1 Tax=Nocardioides thalensis TaxID=1914755 RepID=A0A853C684_9ACTN|nr:histidine kinase [Nocardioides thalensis]NYJ02661.1 signal transduction histidine kinase [Nocardioides thalensis]